MLFLPYYVCSLRWNNGNATPPLVYAALNEELTLFVNTSVGSPITYEVDWRGDNVTTPFLDISNARYKL